MRLLGMAATLTILMALPSTVSAQGPSGPRHRPWLSPDRLEDVRDRRHVGGRRDRLEDVRDRREDVRDRREDIRDRREDRRDRRR
jgi:hypothetical protein